VQANQAAVLEHFNCVQPAVYAAWGGFWPENKPANIASLTFNTQKFDTIVNWAKSRNLTVVHYMMIGHNFYHPQWFKESNYSPEELDSLMHNYVKAVITSNSNGTKIDVFNLINEVVSDSQTPAYRKDGNEDSDCKWMEMGMEPDKSGLSGSNKVVLEHPVFIGKFFKYAAKYTDKKLEIRDYAVELSYVGDSGYGKNAKQNLLYQLVAHLKNSGVKVDAVGFQAHFNAGTDNYHKPYDYNDLKSSINKFKALGLDVYLTELDVGLVWDDTVDAGGGTRVPKSVFDWINFEKVQATSYYNFIKSAREAGVPLISTWGIRDGSMANWRKDQRAWMLRQDYSRKPAYEGFLQALKETK
jgi:endo-1,4-beta-xylanase